MSETNAQMRPSPLIWSDNPLLPTLDPDLDGYALTHKGWLAAFGLPEGCRGLD